MKRYPPLLMILASFVVIFIAAMRSHLSKLASTQASSLPRVTIPLLGAAKDISINGLQPDIAKHFLRSSDLLEPHVLTIRMPNGKSIMLKARSMSFCYDLHDRKTIRYLYVRRPLQPLPFQDVVTDLQNTVKEMGCRPNETMLQMTKWGNIPGWEKHVGMPYDHNAGRIALSDHVLMDVRVMPDPRGGWFYLMMISVKTELPPSTIPAHQQGRLSPTQPTSQSATWPSTYPGSAEEQTERWKQWRRKHDKIDLDRLLNDPSYSPGK